MLMRIPRTVMFAALLMGFTSLAVQTLLIREFLVTFYGNELTIGFVIANWVMLVALGSAAASPLAAGTKRAATWFAAFQAGISLYLPFSIFIIRNIHNLLGLTIGERIGILPIAFTSFLTLAPLGIFIGALFPFACRMLSDISKQPVESTGRIYVLDAAGFIIAGPAITLLLISSLNSFAVAAVLCLFNLASGAFLLKDKRDDRLSFLVFASALILFIAAALSFFGPADKAQISSLKDQWKGQDVVRSRNSLYGNLTVTASGDQYTFYSDGIPVIITPTPDAEFAENLAHFPMLSHPQPKDILLIGGGPGGVIRELLKHPLEKLTYVELDPLLIEMLKDLPTEMTKEELADPRLTISYGDGRRFVRLARSSYDVIIVNLPMPSTLQLNRFYTKEFFRGISSILDPGGLFCFSLPSSLAYMSPEMRSVNGSILKSLRDVFHVRVIPGDYNLYIASKKDTVINAELLAGRLAERGIAARMTTGPYLAYRLGTGFSAWFEKSMADMGPIRENFDLTPAATFYAISYWNALFSPRLQGFFTALNRLNSGTVAIALIGAGALLIAIQLFKRSRSYGVGLAIASSGFAGMSLNLMLIYAYQSFYGFVFQHFALLSASFMAGLAIGGWVVNRNLGRMKNAFGVFASMEGAFVAFPVLVGALLPAFNASGLNLAPVFYALLAMTGFLVGAEFPIGAKLYGGTKSYSTTGGVLYAIDLAGSYLAALVVSVALVPIIGIVKTCVLLALLKAISLANLLISKR